MASVLVVRVTDSAARTAAYAIRREVFIDEQRVPADDEFDEHDAEAVHVLATVDGEPAGTGRIYYANATGRIGRMAVRRRFRRFGVGRAILIALIGYARARGERILCLHAQTHAIPFYESVGFRAEGLEFDEAGIRHRRMTLDLGAKTAS